MQQFSSQQLSSNDLNTPDVAPDAAPAVGASPLLGASHDTAYRGPARGLWLALRDTMLDALAYEKARADDRARADAAQWHPALLRLDEQLTDGLLSTDPAAYAAYLAADTALQEWLLTAAPGAEGATSRALDAFQAAQQAALASGADGPSELLGQKLHYLRQLAGPTLAGLAPEVLAQRQLRAYRHYYAWRKVQYLEALEAAWQLNPLPYDEDLMRQQLRGKSDLALRYPAHLVPAPAARPVLRARPVLGAGPALEASTGPAEVAAMRQELAAISTRLKDNAINFSSTDLQNAERLKAYTKTYSELTQQRAAVTYLLDQRQQELPLHQWGKEKALDWVNTNRANTGQLVAATGQTLMSTVGVAVARALRNKANKLPDDPELGQQILTGLLITGGTALATYFLGPLGPALAGVAIGCFLPQPNPVQEGLKQLGDQLKLNQEQTMKRFNEVSQQINSGFEAVTAQLRHLDLNVRRGNEDLKFSAYIDRFVAQINEADRLLTAIQRTHAALFGEKKHTADGPALVALHQQLVGVLAALLEEFCYRQYQLTFGGADASALPAPDSVVDVAPEPTLVETLLRHYQQPLTFQPFHVACAEITALSTRLRVLVLRYMAARQQVHAVLGAIVVFHEEPARSSLLTTTQDLHIAWPSQHVACIGAVAMLEGLALGFGNRDLYAVLLPYLQAPADEQQFNLLRGFALLDPAQPGHQWLPDAGDGTRPATGLHVGKRAAAAGGGLDVPARYYIGPLTPAQSQRKAAMASGTPATYQLFSTWQLNGVLHRLTLHLALAKNDEVLLYGPDLAAAAPPIRARVVTLADAVFASSLEHDLQRAAQYALDDLVTTPLQLRLPAGTPTYLDVRATTNPPGSAMAMLKLHVCLKHGEAPGEVVAELGNYLTVPRSNGPHTVELALDTDARPCLRVHQGAPDGPKRALLQQYDLTALLTRTPRSGWWTTAQALGTFQPAVSGVPSDRQPFRHLLFPEDELVSLRSPDGTHWLRLERGTTAGVPVLYYYGPAGARPGASGSVFNHYDYRANSTKPRVVLQTDGNFVLYDEHRQALAASHTNGRENSLLHLDNTGTLQLLAPDGTERQRLIPYIIRQRQGELGSFVRTHDREFRRPKPEYGDHVTVLQNHEWYAPNGAYKVQLVYEGGDGKGFAFVRYRRVDKSYERVDQYRKTRSLIAPVRYWSINIHTGPDDCWDECSDNIAAYIKSLRLNDSEMRVLLDFENDGEVAIRLVTWEAAAYIKTRYGRKTIEQLAASTNGALYLALENDGSLRLRRFDTDAIVRTLLEPA